MPAFKADARLYARPLSYEYIDQAVPKELVVDYDKGDLYIKDSSGNVHSITVKVTEQIKEIIKEDPKTIIDNVKIEVTNPTTGEKETITLEQTIINQYTYITNILKDLDGYDDTSTEPPTHVPGVKDKVSGLDKDMNGYTDTTKNPPEYVPGIKDDLYGYTDKDGKKHEGYLPSIGDIIKVKEDIIEKDSEGNVKVSIKPENIKTDANHQFVTEEQISNINTIASKAEIFYKKVIIYPENWQGSEAPYQAILTIKEAKEGMRPTMDLCCSASYEISEKEEDAYCIYRGVVTDGQIVLYNRVKPEVALTLLFEFKTPTTDKTNT